VSRAVEVKQQKSGRLRWVGLVAVLLVVAAIAAWLLQQRQPVGLFGNTRRDVKAMAASGRVWAEPIELAGVTNLHKVSSQLYRGAQPTAEGMRQLKRHGIKTIVNLRSAHSDRDVIGESALHYEHIEMKPWVTDDDEVVWFLKVVTDANRTPAFVHCRRGADRTGAMCAIYRIFVQGWTREQAVQEMTAGGFGFHPRFDNLADCIRGLDIDEIKERAGLAGG